MYNYGLYESNPWKNGHVWKTLFKDEDLAVYLLNKERQLEKELKEKELLVFEKNDEEEFLNVILKKYLIEKIEIGEVQLDSEQPIDIAIDKSRIFESTYYLYQLSIPILTGDTQFLTKTPSAGSFNFPRGEICGRKILLKIDVDRNNTTAGLLYNRGQEEKNKILKFLSVVNSDIEKFNARITHLAISKYRNTKLEIGNHKQIFNGFEKEDAQVLKPENFEKYKPQYDRMKTEYKTGVKKEKIFANNFYKMLLDIISTVGENIEKDKSLHSLKEEQLRSIFGGRLKDIPLTTISYENKNKNGKTDISILFENKLLFVIECKCGTGEQLIIESLEQLLGYLTEKELYCSLIFFNKTKTVTKQKFYSLLSKTLKENFDIKEENNNGEFLQFTINHDDVLRKLYVFSFTLR